MDAEVFRAWIVSAAGVIEANRDHLTQLDAAIGDADHGINLTRGFTAVLGVLGTSVPTTPGAILTVTGNTLISKVGGASGPLYGTAFRRAGKALGDAADVDLPAPPARGTRRWSTPWPRRRARSARPSRTARHRTRPWPVSPRRRRLVPPRPS